ncbi:hypothetical protein [Belliella pelovolcani]|uniref:hypothetical protein n=1 Tax=Belliella pelovolcani TaxID=529505 RepID=UPI00391DE61E
MSNVKFRLSGFLLGVFFITCLSLSTTEQVKAEREAELDAGAWKIQWVTCSSGTKVIRCRTKGVEDCYANWQELC